MEIGRGFGFQEMRGMKGLGGDGGGGGGKARLDMMQVA